MTKRTGTIERYDKGKEDCSPVPEDPRSTGESFTKEGSRERNPFSAAVSP